MNKKGIEPFTVGIIIIGIVSLMIGGALVEKGVINLKNPFAISPPGGGAILQPSSSSCIQLPHPNDPTYNNVTSSSSYTCNDDECLVSGSMSVDKSSPNQYVVFRYGGNYQTDVYGDSNNDGFLEDWEYQTSGSKRPAGFKLSYKTPSQYSIWIESGGIFIYTGGSDTTTSPYYRYTNVGGGTTSNFNPNPTGVCPSSTEVCSTNGIYEAFFNFCPSGTNTFPFCTGSNNDILSPTPFIAYTDEYRLKKGQTANSVTFTPKNKDGSDVTIKSIRSRNFDCSTCSQVANSCKTGELYCKPQWTCPSSYTMVTSGTYAKLVGGSYQCFTASTSTPYCTQGTGTTDTGNCNPRGLIRTDVIAATQSTNIYLKCDGSTTTANGLQCSIFKSQGVCTGSQQCIVSSTNQIGEGIGLCKCTNTPNSCGIGDVRAGDDSNSNRDFQRCDTSLSCPVYKANEYCPTNTHYDTATKTCAIDSSIQCTYPSSQCISSTQLRSCTQTQITSILNNLNVNIWGTSNTCPGELKCDTKGDTLNNDVCSCAGVDENKTSEIKCTSQTTYTTYSKDPNNANSCYKYRDLGNTKNIDFNYQMCDSTTNSFKPRPDTTCKYENVNPLYACPSNIDASGVKILYCSANAVCEPTVDGYMANSSNYIPTIQKRCDPKNTNQVQIVAQYTINTTNYYRWINDTSASNANKGLCNLDYTCLQSGNTASCELIINEAGVFTKPAYSINEKIKNVTVKVSSSVGQNKDLPITFYLLDSKGQPLTDLNGNIELNSQTGLDGTAIFDTEYSSSVTKTIIARAKITLNDGRTITREKNITIGKGLDISIICNSDVTDAAILIVGRPNTCYIKIVDSSSGSGEVLSLSSNLTTEITIYDGDSNVVPYTPLSSFGSASYAFSINPSKGGSYNVNVKTKSSTYLTSEQSDVYIAQDPTFETNFNFDNKAYQSLAKEDISTGSHTLTFEFKESGVPLEPSRVVFQVVPPSGTVGAYNQGVDIQFRRVGPGKYEGSYNFAQPGSTYTITGEITINGKTKKVGPFPIVTLASTTKPGNTTLYIVLGVIGGIFIVAILLLAFIFPRGKINIRRRG